MGISRLLWPSSRDFVESDVEVFALAVREFTLKVLGPGIAAQLLLLRRHGGASTMAFCYAVAAQFLFPALTVAYLVGKPTETLHKSFNGVSCACRFIFFHPGNIAHVVLVKARKLVQRSCFSFS